MTHENQMPTRQSLAAKDRSGPLKVTGRLKVAIEAMLYEGLTRPDAAAKAGITDHAVRCAMHKPHVAAFYNEGLQVLRSSERARNIHRLAKIRDAADNQPAVNAVKVLEQLADDDGRFRPAAGAPNPGWVIDLRENNRQIAPGLNIQINVGASDPADQATVIDHTAPSVASVFAGGGPRPRPVTIEHEPPPADPIFRRPRD